MCAVAAKQCNKPLEQQLEVVAEFHAHKIAPVRIAYRTGIKIDLVEGLLAGEIKPKLFQYLLKQAKIKRRDQRLKASLRYKGAVRRSLQSTIEADV